MAGHGRAVLGAALIAASVGGLAVGSVAPAGAVPSTLDAYPKGSTTPTTCPMTSTAATQCSLARAIALAATGDTVALAVAGTSKTASTTYYEGAFRISKSITLEAATGVTGPVIDAEGKAVVKTGLPTTTSQALVVDRSATVQVEGVILTSGVTVSTGPTEGSRGKGGDIENAGTLAIEDCTVSAGIADWGAGVYNTGTLTVTGSTFTHDTALLTGGAIFSTGHLTVEHSTFTTNSSVGLTPVIFFGLRAIKRGGGAVESSTGTASISDSTFTKNGTLGLGGAVLNRGGSHMSVEGSTFTGAGATNAGKGGAIANYDTSGTTLAISPATVGSTLTVSRSTITKVGAIEGAALYNTGVATLVDSTISTTVEGKGAGGTGKSSEGSISDNERLSMEFDTLYHAGGGLTTSTAWTAHPSISVADSILDNTTCAGATLVDDGDNVATAPTCGSVAPAATPGATLELTGTLRANTSTGPETLAIGPKSAALDVVPGLVCASTAAFETDERGKPRPGITGQSSCDAGAFELQGSGASPVITSAPATTFDVGATGAYALTVTTTTFPDPTYTLTATAPLWLSAVRAPGTGFTGVLEGTPPPTSGGVYHLVVSAANGVGSDAQPFTLSVDEAPVITSLDHADFVTTKAGSFQVAVRTST